MWKRINSNLFLFFKPNGELLATVNDLELYEIRFQIKNQEVEGYYIMFEGQRITILTNGQLSDWPKGFFDKTDYYLSLLLDFGS